MEKRNKVVIIIILVLIAVIGSYIGYIFFINSEFNENMRLGLYYETASDNKHSEAYGLINSTFSSEEEWNIGKNAGLIAFNDSIMNLEKSIYYRQKMIDTGTNSAEKEYGGLLFNYTNKN